MRSKKKRAKGLAYGILTPETSFTTSNQEKETESTSTRPNSRIENFLLRSAASSSSINSQYSDLRNEFSKYSRPRSGKDDDWRGSPTGFSPSSGGVSRGIILVADLVRAAALIIFTGGMNMTRWRDRY